MLTLTCKRGDTFKFDGQHTHPVTGNPESLTGSTVASAMQLGAVRVVLLVTILDAAQGTFRLSLTSVESAVLTPGLWLSDVEFTNAATEVTSTETYIISIGQDITNAPN